MDFLCLEYMKGTLIESKYFEDLVYKIKKRASYYKYQNDRIYRIT